MTNRTVILTRPMLNEAAHPLDLALKREGLQLHHWPLIETSAPVDTTHLLQAWSDINCFQAVMFVSPQAVQHFFAHRPLSQCLALECWATGPGTRDALLKAGVELSKVQMPNESVGIWDTDQLWLAVKHRVGVGDRVLIVRGGQAKDKAHNASPDNLGVQLENNEREGVGRAFLAQQLGAHGVEVQFVVAYLRSCPLWDEVQSGQAHQALKDGSVWLFTSAQAAQHLARLMPDISFSAAKALATHERIAQELEQLGFGVVVRSRPQTTELLASLKSFQ